MDGTAIDEGHVLRNHPDCVTKYVLNKCWCHFSLHFKTTFIYWTTAKMAQDIKRMNGLEKYQAGVTSRISAA